MLIQSDTSDISEWVWIAGSLPCRDLIRKRYFSDKDTKLEPNIPTLNSHITLDNIKTEIIPAGQIRTQHPSTSQTLKLPKSNNQTNRRINKRLHKTRKEP